MANTKITKASYTYSSSVNIIRDRRKLIRYIPTYNGQRAFEQIIQNASLGHKAFTIVGAYGSGKSTFLWALAESAQSDNKYFENFDYLLKGYAKNQLLDLVGDYKSIIDSFAKELNTERDQVLDTLKNYAHLLNEQGTALIIRIDEFGKFLEFAAKTNPEGDFYFLQQLAELVNDPAKNILLITTLHQDFSAYAYRLSETQRKEWTKVKGRFKEITFNEPPEQLLLVASERLGDIKFSFKHASLVKLLAAIDKAKAFPLKDYFNIDIAEKLIPIEILAGSALTIALQRYGQNERSLFSFIESQDYQGLKKFIEKPTAMLYSLPNVYDYLIYHYYHQLTIKDNPDYRAWNLMRESIQKAESNLDNAYILEANQIIKVIGLLNLFSGAGSRIDDELLQAYCALVLNHIHTKKVLDLLQQQKIVHYRKFSQRYILFDGTDVDIDLAIDEAGKLIEYVGDVSIKLNSYFDFPIISAKKYQLDYGTPRYFEFRISEEPINEQPRDERDGFINLVFTERNKEYIKEFSATIRDTAILYVFFKNTQDIKENILEIEQVKRAKEKYMDDFVARQEFDKIIQHKTNLLRHLVINKFYTADKKHVLFYFQGEEVKQIKNRRSLNNFLSTIAEQCYRDTPRYLNEMVNKTRLSSPILTARKYLLQRLVDNIKEPDLDFDPNKYPPEKTIYLSLIKDKGFHREIDGIWQLVEPSDLSFSAVWESFEKFLDNAKHAKLSLQELVDSFLAPPLKLKKGFIDFLMPLCLLVRQSDFALFNRDGFIPKFSGDILDLIVKKPSDYYIKSFSASGIHLSVLNKYRALLNQKEAKKASNIGFIETIRPFLSFYKNLMDYGKNTQTIPKEAINLRNAIKESTDPERTFFEEFPQAIGYSLAELDQSSDKLEAYFVELKKAITDIRTSYQHLLGRYETFVLEEIIGDTSLSFNEWKAKLQNRYKNIKAYLVPNHLKVFLQRINSSIDDRDTWLSSLAQAIIGKQLEEFDDAEELILYDKFRAWIHELDNYLDFDKHVKQDKLQESIRVEITTLDSGVIKQVLTMPKTKAKEIQAVESRLKEGLTKDKNLNIFILSKMLNEQLK